MAAGEARSAADASLSRARVLSRNCALLSGVASDPRVPQSRIRIGESDATTDDETDDIDVEFSLDGDPSKGCVATGMPSGLDMLETVPQGATRGIEARFSRFRRFVCQDDIRCTEVWHRLSWATDAARQPARLFTVCCVSPSPFPAGVHAHDD